MTPYCTNCNAFMACAKNEVSVETAEGPIWMGDRYECGCGASVVVGWGHNAVSRGPMYDKVHDRTKKSLQKLGPYYTQREPGWWEKHIFFQSLGGVYISYDEAGVKLGEYPDYVTAVEAIKNYAEELEAK